MITEILVLSDKYSQSLKDISNLMKSMPVYGYNKYICEVLNINYKQFINEVKLIGINQSSFDLWVLYLSGHGYSIVCSTIASELKIKKEHIEYNPIVQKDVIISIANYMALIKDFKIDLVALIVKGAKLSCKEYGNEIRYTSSNRNSFKGKVRNGSIQFSVYYDDDSIYKEREKEKLKLKESLSSLNGVEFKTLLHNIYSVTELMGFSTQDASVNLYTLFGCFMNIYSSVIVKQINTGVLYPNLVITVDNTSSSEQVRKYRKYDKLMNTLLPFLVGDITSDNVTAIATTVCQFLFFEWNSQTTFFARGDNLSLSELSNWNGNFDLKKKFAKTEHADKFTTFMVGILSLHKLFKTLEKSKVSIFCIDADVFKFEDPADKFINLYELVKYSRKYCTLRREHSLNSSIGKIINSDLRNINFNIINKVPNNFGNTKKLLNKIVEGSWGEIPLQSDIEYVNLSFQKCIVFLAYGFHPVLSLLDNIAPDEKYNEDEELELLKKLEYIHGIYIENFHVCQYDYDDFIEELRVMNDGLSLIIEDLYPINLDFNEDANTLKLIYFIFYELNSIINNITKAPDNRLVSQFELSLACSKSGLSSKFSNFDNTLTDIERYQELLNIVFGIVKDKVSLTKDEINDCLGIFNQEYMSYYLNNLILKVRNALDEVYLLSSSSNTMLDSLLDKHVSPTIVGRRLVEVHSTMNYRINEESFSLYVQQNKLSRDEEGYLRNKNNEYIMLTKGDKYGYLHTMGVYIFSDRSIEIWKE